jgi:hypothetical protein
MMHSQSNDEDNIKKQGCFQQRPHKKWVEKKGKNNVGIGIIEIGKNRSLNNSRALALSLKLLLTKHCTTIILDRAHYKSFGNFQRWCVGIRKSYTEAHTVHFPSTAAPTAARTYHKPCSLGRMIRYRQSWCMVMLGCTLFLLHSQFDQTFEAHNVWTLSFFHNILI